MKFKLKETRQVELTNTPDVLIMIRDLAIWQ